MRRPALSFLLHSNLPTSSLFLLLFVLLFSLFLLVLLLLSKIPSSLHRCCAIPYPIPFNLYIRPPPLLGLLGSLVSIYKICLQLSKFLFSQSYYDLDNSCFVCSVMLAAAKPIIQTVSPLPVPPFLLDDKFYDTLSQAPSLDMNVSQPLRAC